MNAVRLMRGPKGEAVSLVVERQGQPELLTFTIVRDLIKLQSVKSRLIDNHYGYVRISQFQERTGNDLREQLSSLQDEAGGMLSGLVLDLRNNPGGLLDQAVTTADLFLKEGLIVYTEGRDPDAQLQFTASEEGTEPAYPMVVLINGGSASASEIVAGALQDHARAVVLGEQSFGKGSVQTIVPLGDDSGLRLTTARYFTPLGRSIQAKGITPDVVVLPLSSPHSESDGQVREEDLENHIKAAPIVRQQDNREAQNRLTKVEDFQLKQALAMLKGFKILRQSVGDK